MSSISTFVACPEIQETLMRGTGFDNQPLGNVNILRFLLSDLNRNEFINEQINFRPNGLKQVVLTYGQRFLESQVNTGGKILCQTGDTDGITSNVYEIDPDDGANKSLVFDSDDLLYMCENNPSFLAGELKKLMDVIVRKMETDAAIELMLSYGNFAKYVIDGGAPANTVITGATKTASGGINTEFEEKINFNSMVNEYVTKPWLFGGEKLANYMVALGAACCSDLGIDAGVYSLNSGLRMAYSDRVTLNADNADDVIAVVPKMFKMLTFNKFRGENGNILTMNDDFLKQGVLMYPDAALPILFDYRAEYKCTEGTSTHKWHISLGKVYKFIPLVPSDAFQAEDQLFGVNGVNHYRIVNP